MRINKHDTQGTKPLLGKGELGYDDYVAGGDVGRVYVGTGSGNIALAEKSEVDSHVNRVDNPHSVTKAQVGLGSVDNTADVDKNVLSATKWTTARTITLSGDVAGSVSMDGTANVSITTTVQPNSVALGTDTTGNYVAGITQGTGITVSGTAGEGWSPTVAITNVGAAGTYTKVTTNAQGQVTSGTSLSASDIPSLDASKITTGIIDAARLPAFVDDVLEFANQASFPATGESGKIYVALDTNKTYRWSGSVYVYITSGAVDSVNGQTGVVNITTITGNAGTATALQTARTVQTNLGSTASASFNGSANITPGVTGTLPVGNGGTGATTLTGIVKGNGTGAMTAATAGTDYVIPSGSISGNAGTATKLQTSRNIALAGAIVGSVNFDGSADVSISTTLGAQSFIQSSGLSSSWGSTNGTSTGAVNAIMGTSSSATWLLSGTSGGVFRSGIQSLDSNGTLRLYSNSNYIEINGNQIAGNISTASALSTGRTIGMTGDVTWTSASFNGSANVTGTATLANSGVTAGTYKSVTVDAKGRVTAGTNPTTLSGYGITDAQTTLVSGTNIKTINGTSVLGSGDISTIQTTITGNAGTATTLQTARTINGVSFDGSANITITDSTKLPLTGGTLTGDIQLGANKLSFSTTTPDIAWLNYGDRISAGTTLARGVNVGNLLISSAWADSSKVPTNGAYIKGNIAINNTPTVWTTASVLEVGGLASYGNVFYGGSYTTGGAYFGSNANYNGGWLYNATTDRPAAMISLNDTGLGSIDFNVASAGTSNSAITWKKAVTIDNNGVLNASFGITGTSFNSITGLASVAPIVAGTAAVGTSTLTARQDHVHPAQTTITGNAGTATTLQTARTISGVSFNGSANIDIEDRLGTAIASAATTTVGTRGLGDYIHITGTTTITSFGTAAAAGVRRTLIFDGALTLTHNATSLICPGAANIVTVAGTVIEVVAETTANWRVVSITHPSLSMGELGYLDGVTSAIQTQINAKAPLASPAFTGTPTVNGVAFSGYSGFKNYIINGNFDVWQRGASQTTNGYGSDDRWGNGNFGSTKTHSQIPTTDTERALFNASYFSRTVVASVAGASNNVNKFQYIEDVNKLAGKTVTLSFWAKANSAKNIAFDLGQLFGTGGTPSSDVTGVGAQLIALTTTWQKFTKTIVIPNIVGKTLGTDGAHTTATYVNFWFDAGSSLNSRSASLGQQSGTFDIAQVQLEEGSIATPFECRPYGLELSLCQRYYETSGNNTIHWATSTPTLHAINPIIRYAVPKRVTPTLSVTEVTGTLGIQVIGNSIYGFDFRNTNDNVSGAADKYFIFAAFAEL